MLRWMKMKMKELHTAISKQQTLLRQSLLLPVSSITCLNKHSWCLQSCPPPPPRTIWPPLTSHIQTAIALSTSFSVWKFQMQRVLKFGSGADPPLEVVSGPYYWRTKPVWTDKPVAWSGGVSIIQTDNCTDPSLNLIKRNFPQINVTGPNKVT